MGGRTTGSRLTWLEACPGSGSLPWTQVRSDRGAAGTSVHAYIENVVNGVDPEQALSLVREDCYETCQNLDIDRVLWAFKDIEAPVQTEVTYCWSPETGEGCNASERGEEPEGWQLTRIDLVAVSEDFAVVLDVKTYPVIESVKENPQLLLSAVAVAATHGLERVRVALCSVKSDGKPFTDYHDLDFFELEAAAERLRAIDWKRADAARVYGTPQFLEKLAVGPHCQFCSAALNCPALARACGAVTEESLIQAMGTPQCPDCLMGERDDGYDCATCKGTGHLLNDDGSHPLGFPEEVDWQAAWMQFKAVEKSLDRMKAAFRRRTEAGPIDIGDKEIRFRPTGNLTRFKLGTVQYLRDHITEDELLDSLTPALSKEGLRRHLTKEVFEDVMERLEGAGLIELKPKSPALHAYKKEKVSA